MKRKILSVLISAALAGIAGQAAAQSEEPSLAGVRHHALHRLRELIINS